MKSTRSLSDRDMRKVKIEICDSNGELVTVVMSGQVSKERLVQILDVFNASEHIEPSNSCYRPTVKTTKLKILDVINFHLAKVWFTSKDLSLLYQQQYHELVKSSTISTYLSRLYSNGFLERKGNRSCWQYKLVVSVSANNVHVEKIVEGLQEG